MDVVCGVGGAEVADLFNVAYSEGVAHSPQCWCCKYIIGIYHKQRSEAIVL